MPRSTSSTKSIRSTSGRLTEPASRWSAPLIGRVPHPCGTSQGRLRRGGRASLARFSAPLRHPLGAAVAGLCRTQCDEKKGVAAKAARFA